MMFWVGICQFFKQLKFSEQIWDVPKYFHVKICGLWILEIKPTSNYFHSSYSDGVCHEHHSLLQHLLLAALGIISFQVRHPLLQLSAYPAIFLSLSLWLGCFPFVVWHPDQVALCFSLSRVSKSSCRKLSLAFFSATAHIVPLPLWLVGEPGPTLYSKFHLRDPLLRSQGLHYAKLAVMSLSLFLTRFPRFSFFHL